jgi:hypothetical protein
MTCPRIEGDFAAEADPFGAGLSAFMTIGIVNRPDLMPADGSHCGEYRMVFARKDGQPAFMILESVLPNPTPAAGLQGCRPVQAFWRDLSSMTEMSTRAAMLKEFYFNGLPGFRPVIHARNFDDGPVGSGGRVRTNQFIASPWMLRELKLKLACGSASCDLVATPVSNKDNPHPSLFSSDGATGTPKAFQDFFLTKVKELAQAPTPEAIAFVVSDPFNTPESLADFTHDFGSILSPAFATRIANRLAADGITGFSPAQIVNRATTQSCAGCHNLSSPANLGGGMIWPASIGFTHLDQVLDADNRFRISAALRDVFLPDRLNKMGALLEAPAAAAKIRKTALAMTVDGNLSELGWDLSRVASKVVLGTPNDLVKWGALWNDQFLFVGVQVTDATVKNDSVDDPRPWEDDSIEVYVDGNNNRGTAYDGFDRQFVKGARKVGLFEKSGNTANVLHATALTATGYTVELAIPWSNLGLVPTANMELGLEIGANDDDDADTAREGQYATNGTSSNHTNTASWGRAQLDPVAATARRRVGTITVDGNVAEADYVFGNELAVRTIGDSNNRVTWAAVWDTAGLFVAARVLDDGARNDSTNPWEDDSFELYLDADHTHGTAYDAQDRQFVIGRGDPDTALFERFGRKTGVIAKTVNRADGRGYTVEMFVPWSNLGIATPASGKVLGFDVGCNDDDTATAPREGQTMWAGTKENWSTPGGFGDLRLQ